MYIYLLQYNKGLFSGDQTKNKWKNLKDKFRREINKPSPRSGSGAIPARSKWHFFELMKFTRDTIIAPAKMVESLSTPTDSISNDEESEDVLEDMAEGEEVDEPNRIPSDV